MGSYSSEASTLSRKLISLIVLSVLKMLRKNSQGQTSRCIVLCGPATCGKTSLAIAIEKQTGCNRIEGDDFHSKKWKRKPYPLSDAERGPVDYEADSSDSPVRCRSSEGGCGMFCTDAPRANPTSGHQRRYAGLSRHFVGDGAAAGGGARGQWRSLVSRGVLDSRPIR